MRLLSHFVHILSSIGLVFVLKQSLLIAPSQEYLSKNLIPSLIHLPIHLFSVGLNLREPKILSEKLAPSLQQAFRERMFKRYSKKLHEIVSHKGLP